MISFTYFMFSFTDQISNQEMRDSGRRFDYIISLTIHFRETSEING